MLNITHTDREGNTQLVAQMDTIHILNYLLLILRNNLEDLVVEEPEDLTKYQRKLYGIKKYDPDVLANATHELMLRLSPYMLEMFFRFPSIESGSDEDFKWMEVCRIMQKYLARDGRLSSKIKIKLPASTAWANDLIEDNMGDW